MEKCRISPPNKPMEPTAYRSALFAGAVSTGFIRRHRPAAHGQRWAAHGIDTEKPCD